MHEVVMAVLILIFSIYVGYSIGVNKGVQMSITSK